LKIAVVTEDGSAISQHFGRAPYYAVITVEEGEIAGKEMREKAGHPAGVEHHCHDEGHNCHGKHGMDAASQTKHRGMLANILDCQVLIAGGMGWGAFESLKNQNIQPIITDVKSIEQAVQLYIDDKIVNLTEKLH